MERSWGGGEGGYGWWRDRGGERGSEGVREGEEDGVREGGRTWRERVEREGRENRRQKT